MLCVCVCVFGGGGGWRGFGGAIQFSIKLIDLYETCSWHITLEITPNSYVLLFFVVSNCKMAEAVAREVGLEIPQLTGC
jgi:hypothetical protein